VCSSSAVAIKSHANLRNKNFLKSKLSNQQLLTQRMRDDDQDLEVTDGQLSQFANFAENEEQIASKMNLVDDDVLADPIPIIP